jgi:HPt (histidine-containing phosphotransfer) domain-containing protein
VDLEELLARCVGNREFAVRVLNRFVSCFGEDLCRLERHLQSREPQELARIAHTMKGAAANVAAHRLADLVGNIEAMARAARLAETSSPLAELRREWSRVADAASTIGAGQEPAP